METVPLSSLAKAIRSKNAGVDKITFDVIFARREDFDAARLEVRRDDAETRRLPDPLPAFERDERAAHGLHGSALWSRRK